EPLLVVDDDRVQHADASDERRARPKLVSKPGVLRVAVLDAYRPPLVVRVGGVVSVLKYVGRDTDCPVVTRRHAKGEIGSIQSELVGMLAAQRGRCCRIGAIAVAAENHAGEIERRRHGGWWRR